MPAYLIVNYNVNDPDLYNEYRKGAGPTVLAHGVKVLVADPKTEVKEGSGPGHQTVVLQFEDRDKLNAWYDSVEYQAVLGKRLAATSGFAVIVDGLG